MRDPTHIKTLNVSFFTLVSKGRKAVLGLSESYKTSAQVYNTAGTKPTGQAVIH